MGLASLAALTSLAVFVVAPRASASSLRLLVADSYSEPDLRDEAAALAILLRATLAKSDPNIVVPADRIRAALARAGGLATYALIIPPAKRQELLRALQASHLIAGRLERRGSTIEATLQLFERGSPSEIEIRAEASAPHLDRLAYMLGQKIALLVKLRGPINRLREVSLGELTPFVRAAQDVLAGRADEAAEALMAVQPSFTTQVTSLAVAATAAMERAASTEEGVIAALALGEPRRALGLAREASAQAARTEDRELAMAAQALALVAQDRGAEAQKVLAGLRSGGRTPLALLARAQLAHSRGHLKQRDALLTQLAEHGYIPALARIADLPLESMSLPLLGAAHAAAQKLDRQRYPGLHARIALAAARRAKELKLAVPPLLAPLEGRLLSTSQRQVLRILAEDAVALGTADGYRLRGDLALHSDDLERAKPDLERALELAPDDERTRLLLARTLSRQGNHAGAARLLEAGRTAQTNGGFELAHELQLAGELEKSDGLRRRLAASDPSRATRLALYGETQARPLTRGGAGGTAKTLALEEAQAEQALDRIRGMLRAFPPLVKDRIWKVALVPLATARVIPFWPLRAEAGQLRRALRAALSAPPYNLTVSSTHETISALARAELAALAKRLDVAALLIYRVAPRGVGHAQVQLVLFRPSEKNALELSEVTSGFETGLVRWNASFVQLSFALALALISWLGYRLIRGSGEINVNVALDPAAAKEALTVLINSNKRAPAIKDPDGYGLNVLSRGSRQTRYRAMGVHRRVRFRRIPAGKHYVHLIGTYEKEGHRQVLPQTLSQRVRVRRRQVAQVTFDLEPQFFRLDLRVFDDDQPVQGAVVWLDDDQTQERLTDRAGQIALQVPRHQQHVVSVQTNEFLIRRPVQHDDTKAHILTINLAKERRMRELSGGITIDGDALSMTDAQGPVATINEIDMGRAGGAASEAGQSAPNARSGSRGGTILAWGADAARPETPGQESGLSRYRQVSELGRGAMGIVFRARDLVLERDVALKVIGPELRRHPVALKLFQQEAKALAALNHPNVVMVYDQGQDGEQTYMVMEYVEGHSLEHIIETGGPLPLQRGIEVAEQICDGLAYAHSKQIIHRDIKPENVLIARDGRVKLGDFGLARVTHELSIQKTEVRGTPLFMSPEQIRGADIDFRTDIYSLGCTLYAVFAGRPPFVDGEILYHHLHTQPPRASALRPHLPAVLDELLLRCIAKDKAERIANVELLRGALEPLKRQVA